MSREKPEAQSAEAQIEPADPGTPRSARPLLRSRGSAAGAALSRGLGEEPALPGVRGPPGRADVIANNVPGHQDVGSGEELAEAEPRLSHALKLDPDAGQASTS